MSTTLFAKKAPPIMERLMDDFPLDVEDAAAILGNIGGETGGFTLMQEVKPIVPGSRGGYGWCQWTGPRRRQFEAWCAQEGHSVDSDAGNYGFLRWELQNTEKQAIPKLKAAVGLRAKTIAFERAFERAGIPHHDSRVRWAERALKAYQAVSSPQPTPAPKPKPPQKPVVKSKTFWAQVLTIVTTILGVVTDWKVLAVLVVALAIFVILERTKKTDIVGWL